jgi:deoxyribodipyrimidine photo-lyase
MLHDVPPVRIALANDAEVRADGAYVLYWMTAARRTRWSFALDRAVRWARELARPLVVLEALRVDHPWACDRFHAFVIDGMRDNAAAFARAGVTYLPYVEPRPGEGKGLVEVLAKRACVVVTDDAPFFFLGRMLAKTAPRLPVRVEAIDGNGLLPLRAVAQDFAFAHQFRRFVQKTIRPHLVMPAPDALEGVSMRPVDLGAITARWPAADLERVALAQLPIDHGVPVVEDRGGHGLARARLDAFVKKRLGGYGDRSHPDEHVSSGLSFHLHFGHVSAHEVFARVTESVDWSIAKMAAKANGRRDGFWNASEAADGFLDELITWREIGLARAAHRGRDAIAWDDLPSFAKKTLEAHASDRRAYVYDRAALEEGRTHDRIWNAAMRQLREEGRIQSYLRMLWGKKILEWTRDPREALDAMIALNERWSVDGRDPSSYTNVGWVLGMYDRPWAPERPIYGVVRYMSSDAAMRKLRMKEWLARWGDGSHE